MAQAIVAYLHYLSIFLLFALLVLQHRTLRLPLDLERARSLAAIDRGYGLCALAVLASGLARVLWYGKGLDYYLHNGLFHAKGRAIRPRGPWSRCCRPLPSLAGAAPSRPAKCRR